MAGQRRAEYVSIPMGPGILSNPTGRAAHTRIAYMNWDRWKDSSWIRWHKLAPEKCGGWAYQALVDPVAGAAALYQGSARDLHDWASYDNQFWIAIGTNLKLYLANAGVLYDITPIRQSANLNNALTTTSASRTVQVTDNGSQGQGHQANTGDFVDFPVSMSIGGVTLFGTYQLTVVDPFNYTVQAAAAATSSVASGGGQVSLNYEMRAGLASNGILTGYGTGKYGAETYGTPRTVSGAGVLARLRTWSLENYGEDLIASESDGEIYWWQKRGGPNARAILLPNAPLNVQRCLVDAAQRVIIALGSTDVTTAYDPLLVSWCSLDDITDWIPTDVNTASDYQLTAGSRIITGLKSAGQNLIFTDTTLYRMVYVGGTDIYDFFPAGRCYIVGPNATVDVDGVAYFMGFDNIYNYSGTLNLQGCECWETVFDPNYLNSMGKQTALDRTQAEKTVAYSLETETEITWLYQSLGSTTGEVDRYVTFNWEDGSWFCGDWARTCARGRAPAMGGYPYGVNAGYLYQHEVGLDAVEALGTFAIPWYLESLDITTGGAKSEYTMGGSDARFTIGGSDSHLCVRSILPDWMYMTGTMNLTLKTKDRPRDAAYVVSGPVSFTSTQGEIDIDAHGSQIVLRLDNISSVPGAVAPELLLHMDVANGSTSFPDSSGNGVAVTATNMTVSTTSPKFVTGCALASANTANLAWPNTNFALGSADFTIEFWIRPLPLASAYQFFGCGGTSYTQEEFYAYTLADGAITTEYINAAGSAFGGPTATGVVDNAWNHVAFVRHGTAFVCYVNGVAGGASGSAGVTLPAGMAFYHSAGTMTLGKGLWAGTQPYIQFDEIRITLGTAVYTANFTPPNAPFGSGIATQASPGSSFRMGVMQALAFPYAKR